MNIFIHKLIGFLKSTGKLTASIFFAVLGIAVVFYSYNAIESAYIKSKNKKHEVLKIWSKDLPPLGLKVEAKTKLVDGFLLAQLEFEGYPLFIKNDYLNHKNKNSELILKFKDNDNFDIFEHRINVSQLTRRINNNGEDIGLFFQFKNIIETSVYENIKSMNFEWTIDTEIPTEIKNLPKGFVLEKNSAISIDHCAPGLSRAERMRRLALNGTVRESSKDSYSAGSKVLSYFHDGTVLYCN